MKKTYILPQIVIQKMASCTSIMATSTENLGNAPVLDSDYVAGARGNGGNALSSADLDLI